MSTTTELLCGVPQGSILGPTLFLCYINDLARLTRNIGVSIFLYANDANRPIILGQICGICCRKNYRINGQKMVSNLLLKIMWC